jgi:hypothetical protein
MITLDRLQQIIPADQALANKALSVSLQQLTGISNMSLPTLAQVTNNIETTRDLPLITSLEEAVPPSVADYYTSTLAVGGGANGNIRVVDIIGLAAGWIATDAFLRTVEIFSTMNLSYLTLLYQTVANVYNGTYNSGTDPDGFAIITIPSGLPGAGTYNPVTEPNPDPPPPNIETESAADVAFATLYPLIITEIANLISTYPTQTTELNDLFNSMCQQITQENSLQSLINLDYTKLQANSRTSIYSFIFSLSNYGIQTEVGGMAWFLEAMADLTMQSGEAIVACLRQGRNQRALGAGGVYTNSNIPADPIPPPPQAELIPSEYSAEEAANLVIK